MARHFPPRKTRKVVMSLNGKLLMTSSSKLQKRMLRWIPLTNEKKNYWYAKVRSVSYRSASSPGHTEVCGLGTRLAMGIPTPDTVIIFTSSPVSHWQGRSCDVSWACAGSPGRGTAVSSAGSGWPHSGTCWPTAGWEGGGAEALYCV